MPSIDRKLEQGCSLLLDVYGKMISGDELVLEEKFVITKRFNLQD